MIIRAKKPMRKVADMRSMTLLLIRKIKVKIRSKIEIVMESIFISQITFKKKVADEIPGFAGGWAKASELATFSLPARRAIQLKARDGDRTRDLFLGREAFYQLNYPRMSSPSFTGEGNSRR